MLIINLKQDKELRIHTKHNVLGDGYRLNIWQDILVKAWFNKKNAMDIVRTSFTSLHASISLSQNLTINMKHLCDYSYLSGDCITLISRYKSHDD